MRNGILARRFTRLPLGHACFPGFPALCPLPAAQAASAAPSPRGPPDLVASLVSRLNHAETQLQKLRLQLLSAQQEAARWGGAAAAAQAQVADMLSFLRDYGLVWVGAGQREQLNRRTSSAPEDVRSTDATQGAPQGASSGNVAEGAAVPALPCSMEQLGEAIEQLNAAVLEQAAPQGRAHPAGGGAQAASDSGGGDAALPLVVFSDGVQLGCHPARPLGDATVEAVLRDILDGFVVRVAHPPPTPPHPRRRRRDSCPPAWS